MRLMISSRNTAVSAERMIVYNATVELAEHGIYCLSCYWSIDFIWLLLMQLTVHIEV